MRDRPVLREKLTNAESVNTHIIDGGMVPLMEQAPQEVATAVNNFLLLRLRNAS